MDIVGGGYKPFFSFPPLIKTPSPLYNFLPMFGRSRYHSRGEDIVQPNDMMRRYCIDYFIQYIPKRAEYRVHVLGDKVVSVSKKVKRHKGINGKVWNLNNGYKYIEYHGLLKWILGRIGRKAKNALGYDFGAVDIMLGKDMKIYVLEVNSAPRLNYKRRKLYAEYFRNEEKNKNEY